MLPAPGGAVRVGITGAPGAGKSTFIEAFGLHLVDARPPGRRARRRSVEHAQRRLDPRRQDPDGGARRAHPHAFIRPSPTGGTLGGVARRTREAMLLCEAAGFDVVLVETVGVGQSEVAVAAMVDLFLVLVAPGGGDELQGIKRGIMELADLVVVNKADGDLAAAAAPHRRRLRRRPAPRAAPHRPAWTPRVLTCSALTGAGIAEVWDAVAEFRAAVADELPALRAAQSREWMWSEVTDSLLEALHRRRRHRRPRPAPRGRGGGRHHHAHGRRSGSRGRPPGLPLRLILSRTASPLKVGTAEIPTERT